MISFNTGVMSILMGFLAELLMRTYFESQHKAPYAIKGTRNLTEEPADVWHRRFSRVEGDDADLRRMTAALSHRGPDSEGHWRDARREGSGSGTAGSAWWTRRAGSSRCASGDGQLLVVFNGEIYNHAPSCARELSKGAGTVFESHHSDTEVLLHGVPRVGRRLRPERLNGMWAFALLDRPRRRLLLSRDRFGQKPLYYASAGAASWFASELSAVASTSPGRAQRRSRDGAAQVLRLRLRAGSLTRSSRTSTSCPPAATSEWHCATASPG